ARRRGGAPASRLLRQEGRQPRGDHGAPPHVAADVLPEAAPWFRAGGRQAGPAQRGQSRPVVTRFIEVSHPVLEGMKTYPGLPEPHAEIVFDYDASQDRYQG